jgi:hypothetical protein
MQSMVKLAAAAAVALAAPNLAAANVITESQSFGPAATDWSTTFDFSGFNPALGTLTMVTFDLTARLSGSAQVTNIGSTSATGRITLTNTAMLSAPSVLPIVTSVTTQTLGLNPGDAVFFTLGAGRRQVTSTTSELSLFETAWSAGATDHGVTSSSFSRGDVLVDTTDAGALTAQVSYVYTPEAVPEPMTAAVLCSGLAILGIVRRRRA